MSSPWEVRRFTTLESTNTYLLAEARAGAAEGVVAVADHQTAGRGRLGRRWEAPPGRCLLVSVLLRPVVPADRLWCCTAAVALAAADACREVAGVAPLVKWPNDLVVGDRKLAGVLAESDPGAPGGPPGSVAVVVGIGLNIDWSGPDDLGATSLVDHADRPVSRDAVLDSLLRFLAARASDLGAEPGRQELVADLRQRSATLGRRVRVEVSADGGSRPVVGTAVDLAPSGHLVLETAHGTVEVPVGDVVHLRTDDGPAVRRER
jgi:BirA family transcriptional regulator, biotin operon repressor / biotin---[acetyl-CoA-carboxylase] ligase